MTAAYAGFAGHKNGALLDAAEAGGEITTVAGSGPVGYQGGFSGDNGPATAPVR